MATRSLRRLTLLLVMGVVAGCAGLDPYRSGPPPAETVSQPQAPRATPAAQTPAPVAPRPGDAAAFLLEDARVLAAAGEHERAAAQIERALRIERNSPWLYLELAKVRHAQGESRQARALLERARSLAGGDPAVAAAASTFGAAAGFEPGVP